MDTVQIEDYINKAQVEKLITEIISKELDKTGIFYHIWARVKTDDSIKRKLKKREQLPNYKMQDLIGCRVVCYFAEDVIICEDIIKKLFQEKSSDTTIDEQDAETFKPIRRNYVFNLPTEVLNVIKPNLWGLPFDTTFELQSRTILSEGWHEVEHDLRYKHKAAWLCDPNLSRKLNGLLATLETSEWALGQLFDELAYQCYKQHNWTEMLRNKIRLRIIEKDDFSDLKEIFDFAPDLAKKFLNFDKLKLVEALSKFKIALPLSMSNLVFCINQIEIHNGDIEAITPELIKERISS